MRSDVRVPVGWSMHELGALVDVFDGPHATPKKTQNGPVFLGIANLKNGRVDLSNTAHLSEDDFAKWTRRVLPRPGDLVFSYETRLGEAALIPDHLRCCLGRRMGLLRVSSTEVVPRYLLYAYLGPQFQRVIRDNTVHGSTVDRIPLNKIGTFPILLPSRDQQLRILHVMGALDDKIECNRRLTAALHNIAAAIFRERFTCAAGNGSAGHIGPLSELALIKKESIEPAANPDRLYEHFSIPAFDAGRQPAIELGRSILSSKTVIPNSDCALISKLNPATRRVWWPRPTGTMPAICSAEFIVLVPRNGIPNSYLYTLLSTDDLFYRDILSKVTGTTGSRQRVKPDAVLDCPVTIPDGQALQEWDEVARPLYDLSFSLLAEMRLLADIRDALLPKLVVGEILVPNTLDSDEVIGPASDALVETAA